MCAADKRALGMLNVQVVMQSTSPLLRHRRDRTTSTSSNRLISGKVIMKTLDMYMQPKVMMDNLSAVELRHAGYSIPIDLFGPYVTACVQVVRTLQPMAMPTISSGGLCV